MAVKINASFANNRNNGFATAKQASKTFEVGDFLVYDGLGGVIPYNGLNLIQFPSIVGGPFMVGETITGGTSSATAVVAALGGTTYLTISGGNGGTFVAGETITGGSSGATAVVSKYTVRNKILGLSNEQITTASANYATTADISVSTPVNILDELIIPVNTGSATSALVGTYVNVDTAAPGAVTVSAAGTQILVLRVIDTTTIRGAIALTVA